MTGAAFKKHTRTVQISRQIRRRHRASISDQKCISGTKRRFLSFWTTALICVFFLVFSTVTSVEDTLTLFFPPLLPVEAMIKGREYEEPATAARGS